MADSHMIPLGSFLKWGVALVVVVGAYFGWRGHERSVGALEAKIATLEAQTKVLSQEADSLENVFRVDTVRLTKQVSHTDTLLHTLIDSAIVEHHDTITVTKEVLIQADSTIKACTIVVSDCEKGWTNEKALNGDLRAELSAVKAQVPSTAGSFAKLALTFGIGILVGQHVH